MKKNSVLVAHPMQQHSFKLCHALEKQGLLNKYFTTIFIKEKSVFWKLFGKITAGKFENAISKKRCPEIEKKANVICGISGLIFAFLSKVNYPLACKYYFILTKLFGKKIAKYVIKHNDVEAVVMYDFTAVSCFEILKKKRPNVVRVLDMSSIPAQSIKAILDKEEVNGFGKYHLNKRKSYSNEIVAYYSKEIEFVDYFLVPSNYVLNTLVSLGVDKEKCFVAPYGVNTKDFVYNRENSEIEQFEFVFTGRIEAAKGVFYMLDGLNKLWQERQDFRLHLFGALCFDKRDLIKYNDFCEFHGYTDKHTLIQYYNKSHCFILPSLWEGMNLSALEALSCGLPCILSANTGASEYINDGINGFVIKPFCCESVYDKAKWFLENKNLWQKMSNNSRSAIPGTWEDYNNRIAQVFNSIG
ncbi:MAG: glycosyltransferase family 4 protein [Ruminococcaceae bacterium]|nr:glycosyltransferase family 4 protein [Oscillospiraceae bacterium]